MRVKSNEIDAHSAAVRQSNLNGILGTVRFHELGKKKALAREINNFKIVILASSEIGQSCLCLAAARLKHVAGTQWSTRKYMNMDPLREMKLQHNGAAVA